MENPVEFPTDLDAVWIRIVAKEDTKATTAFFIYADDSTTDDEIFSGVADVDHKGAVSGGIIRPLGSNLQSLQYIATIRKADGTVMETNLEVTTDLRFKESPYGEKDAWFKREGTVETLDFEVDAASVIIRDPQGSAYRLPKGDTSFDDH